MMAQKIAERLVWAVETLAIDPSDHVLEIGCGHGLAVSLICKRLAGGSTTAIDRSAAMIEMAGRRNRAHVSSGKAVFQAAAFAEANLGEQRFDKIFAVSVGLFLKQSAGELERIKQLLKPGGVLYVFYQPPTAGKTQAIAGRVTEVLQHNGFSIKDIRVQDMEPAPSICVIAAESVSAL